MDFPGLPGRLLEIRDRIRFHQARGGWSHSVRIVAVTKGHGLEAIRAGVAAGLEDIGENRVQEALAKQDRLGDLPIRWHLIGALQRNKVRHVVGRFALIHSVDRADLVRELERRIEAVGADGPRQPVLIEVNCSGEVAKSGVEPAGLAPLVELVAGSPRLELQGLMTLAAFSGEERVQHAAFGMLRKLRDEMQSAGYRLPELSMGMSGDFPVAVEEGATMVRLGTLLFGERPR